MLKKDSMTFMQPLKFLIQKKDTIIVLIFLILEKVSITFLWLLKVLILKNDSTTFLWLLKIFWIATL